MSTITPQEAREWAERWALVRQAEARELRETPIAVKFRQLAALVASAHLFPSEPDREAQIHTVRERWARLRRALGG